jgi:rod shape-determining protein MreB and related proteins
MLARRLGIDLGTANTLVYVPRRGIVLNEPTVVAVSTDDNRILAVGNEAKEMLGRTPDSVTTTQPLRDGVIADFRITEAMLRYFLEKAGALGFGFLRPEVMISVPAGITSTERRAVTEAALHAGARTAYLVKEPLAAAIGAGIPVGETSGNMIIDIGGGTSEVAVIAVGGIVAAHSERVGGNKIDAAIVEFIRKRHGLAIGERTAEEVKIAVGSALPLEEQRSIEIRGRDVSAGLPKEAIVSSNEVTEAIQDELQSITQAVKIVLQETPPELAADIIDKGVVLSGGGALLRNVDKLIAKVTSVPCTIADDPLLCVIKGVGIALENLEVYKRSLLAVR